MSITIFSGRFLPIGEKVYFDDKYDLAGDIVRKTDRRIEVQWDDGNAVWYPLFHTFYLLREHQRKAS
jgi:hypothetical protein